MQLSLPAASFPTPAATPGCGGKNPAQPSDSSDTPTDSFASLLTKDSPGDDSKGDDGKTNPEAEQAAGILAAMLWMQNPVTPVPAPVLPSILAGGMTAADTTAVADLSGGDSSAQTAPASPTPFFGATNCRAFGKVQGPAITTQGGPFGNLINGRMTDGSVAQQVPSANESNLATPQKTGIAADGVTPVAVGVTPTVTDNPIAVTGVISQVTTAAPTAVKSTSTAVGKTSVRNTVQAETSVDSDKTSESASDEVISPLSSPTERTSVAKVAVDSTSDAKLAPVSSGDPQEKIAPLPAVLKELEKSTGKLIEKYFLEPAQKAVMTASASVGIAIAKVNAAMSSAPSARTKTASLVEPSAAFVFSGEAAPTATLTVDAPAPVATVRETLAAVISAVDAIERRADVQQKSVDLNFHVGNEKLGLRVELKDGAVHTTFRTESPEMSSALSREWHAVVPTAFARDVKLAEPVFHTVATSGSDSSSTSLGQGAQQQQREHQKASPTFASALRREFNDSAVQETAAPAASSAANSSQLLNALA